MPKQIQKEGRRWYAIHVYSGYEENVAENLRQRVDSMDMSDRIFQIIVPTEKRIKIRNGRRRVIREKIFPGYVLVEMDVTDDIRLVKEMGVKCKVVEGSENNFKITTQQDFQLAEILIKGIR